MLGWFEWDEANQRLRVMIPAWDCVDTPRQPAEVVNRRQAGILALMKSMTLSAMQRGAVIDYLGCAAQWLPEDLFDLAQEIMVCAVSTDASLFESAVTFQSMVSQPFNDLVQAGRNCRQEIDDLVALAFLMSRTTRHIYLTDRVARSREKLHDDHASTQPHASINHLLSKLEAVLLIAPPDQTTAAGGALIPVQTEPLNSHIRRLLRRLVFSMDSAFHGGLASCVDALVKAERQSIFHHMAQKMDQISADVPLFAICERLWIQMRRIEHSQQPSALPGSQTLAREVLDEADAWITACAATTYRLTRGYLISLGNRLPNSPQLKRSHELLTQHTRTAAQQRLRLRQRWLGGTAPTASALTLPADPGAQDTDDPIHTWPVERLVRWINGPVTAMKPDQALFSPDQLVARDSLLLGQDRARSDTAPPAEGQKDSQMLTRVQIQEVVWQGLIQSADYVRNELRDLGALADKLDLKRVDRNNAAIALKKIDAALQAMTTFKKSTTVDKAQAELSAANGCLEKLRSAIRPVQLSAERLLRFGECLVQQLRQETLAMGKSHGGVIACPMSMDQWGAVRDRFHRRYCSPVQVLTMGGQRVLLRSDQALALHVTAASLSGYAFDVSVHLWQRVDGSRNDPFDTSSTELFAPMNADGWFDTRITCAVLHVPPL